MVVVTPHRAPIVMMVVVPTHDDHAPMMVMMMMADAHFDLGDLHFAGRFRQPRIVVGDLKFDRIRDGVQQIGIGRRAQSLSGIDRGRLCAAHRRHGGDGAEQAGNLFIHTNPPEESASPDKRKLLNAGHQRVILAQVPQARPNNRFLSVKTGTRSRF
jgi:hypothetical protein